MQSKDREQGQDKIQILDLAARALLLDSAYLSSLISYLFQISRSSLYFRFLEICLLFLECYSYPCPHGNKLPVDLPLPHLCTHNTFLHVSAITPITLHHNQWLCICLPTRYEHFINRDWLWPPSKSCSLAHVNTRYRFDNHEISPLRRMSH